MEAKFFDLSEMSGTEMSPGVMRHAIYMDNTMLTFVEFESGGEVPEHSHPHEQITFVVRGTLRFRLGEEERLISAGCGACCPPHVVHSAVVIEGPAFVIDAWYPPREEYK